ncbi:MAG: hypothetical protein ACYC63_19850 [Armatimonadota bacterium]
MSFLNTLIHGAVGFFTGGPVGAGLAIAGDLLAPGTPKQQPGAPAPVRNAVDINAKGAANDAFIQAYLAQRSSNPPATVFDADKALAGPLSQRANQIGGQMSVPGGNRRPEALGPGRGGAAGGTDKAGLGGWRSAIDRVINREPEAPATPAPTVAGQNSEWRQALSANMAQNQGRYTNGLQPAFQQYMGNALQGRQGLPQEAYNAALQTGMHTINAQAANSRSQLQSNFGARGLMGSGMMGNALLGVEQSRVGAFGQLTTGLAQQDLQARREQQQNAAGMMPSLIGADTSAGQSQWQAMLAGRQLEMEAQRIGISQQQINDARTSGNYSILADLVSAGTQIWGARNNNQPTTTPNPYYNPNYTPNPYAGSDVFI